MLQILASNPSLFYTGMFIFGLLIGSFLNVVILRLPARLEYDWHCQCKDLLQIKDKEEAAKPPPGIVWSRSECRNCGHGITAMENIPLVSYLVLKGRCSSCKAPISKRYPLVELASALMFVMVAMYFGPTIQALAALTLTCFLIALTGIDIDHQLLPDDLTFVLLWMGLFASLFDVFADPASSILGALTGSPSLWLVYHLFRLLTGKEGMGRPRFYRSCGLLLRKALQLVRLQVVAPGHLKWLKLRHGGIPWRIPWVFEARRLPHLHRLLPAHVPIPLQPHAGCPQANR